MDGSWSPLFNIPSSIDSIIPQTNSEAIYTLQDKIYKDIYKRRMKQLSGHIPNLSSEEKKTLTNDHRKI